MNIFHSVILGIVEGLTEFLPISSTFHLIFTSKLLGLAQTDFLKIFEVVIQSGAIFALIFLYAKILLTDKKLFLNVMFSFIPTALIGLVLHKIIKNVFFETNWLMLLVFILVGLVFLLIEKKKLNLVKTCSALTAKDAVIIGLAQACSVIPGVSRAGSVIVAMMLLGYKRDEAAKYTFLLSLPTILAASALDIYQGREIIFALQGSWLLIATGFFTAMLTAYFVVVWFTKYLSTHTLKLFGWYRLIISVVIILTMALL